MNRATALPALLLPVVLLAAACGGDEPDDARAAYLAAAEASCAKANAAQEALTTPSSPDAIAGFVRQVVTIASDTSAELNALEPPPEDAAELEAKLLAPLRSQVEAGQAYARTVEEAAQGSDPAAVLKLLGEAPLDSEVDLEFLRSYGFSACVEAADTSS